MTQRHLPQFLIIGAVKAATTWIADQLRARDDVFLPGPEPHYFSRAYDRGENWYASLFAEARIGQLIGEKSADYLADGEAPVRTAALLPNAMLIAQLRNPVDRAYSDYCMHFRRGYVGGDVERYLGARPETPRFLQSGLYARHIARWRDHFPENRLKIILYDDIRAEPERVLADICHTLHLPPAIDAELIGRRSNDSEAPLVPRPLRRLPQSVKNLVAPLRGNPAFEATRRLFARPVEYPLLTADLRMRLKDYYADDVAQLERLLGRDLSAWSDAARPGR
ncbi:sulfotransferase [Sphingomonas sp. JC676]|uniref:sulfotransferase family protein n=1 Tax=Sphingomonas sp. JC676 TaxID=2768065 RepID=UPI001657BEAC|nr:sulfotransferase [Sphingomonas sp. JC676]MBC9031383.1 sulfotransferase [Sphingomonas sp. JC676]